MRVKSKPVSSLNQQSLYCSSPRTRKKHKRLDAICENAYTQSHSSPSFTENPSGSTKGSAVGGAAEDEGELRRSSRVRRAPVILDASPPPPKKRKKLNRSGQVTRENSGRLLSPLSEEDEDEDKDGETLGSWTLRLRSRETRIRFGSGGRIKSPRGKRKLFEDMNKEPKEEEKAVVRELQEEEVDSDESAEEAEAGSSDPEKQEETEKSEPESSSEDGENLGEWLRNSIAAEPQKIAKGKATSASGDAEEDSDLDLDKEKEDVGNETRGQTEGLLINGEMCLEAMSEPKDADISALAVEVEEKVTDGVSGQEGHDEDGTAVAVDYIDAIMEPVEGGTDGISKSNDEKVDEPLIDRVEGDCHGRESRDENNLVDLDDKPLEYVDSEKVDGRIQHSTEILGFSRVKAGRRCGLCGGGTDGKPPKKLVNELGESENEANHGLSASEEPNYDIWDGFGDEPGWLGRLLGPINDRYGIAGIWVHLHCAVWSPEVYFAGLGCLKNVRAALCRGRALKCTRCGRPGATIGCRVDRCPRTYHLPCARANGCIFDHRKFLIACTDHRHIFQPHGNNNSNWMKRMRYKKLKLEFRKQSNDAWRKDIEAEEKWLENCGEDEEFLKRESRRLHRDLQRISPVYIGGPESEGGDMFQGWESVAGLQDVIRCMKEVVILPLLYPEFFDNLGLTPPRGVLLHGYPGTGKTLVVRALIGSCARGDKRIAYFARKGADCLGKYVGDAECQLRLLFQVAEKCQPSIIFFDEIDGLAPCRTKQQDQTHSSVVSTLLALLDGLKSRGSVVVIGATNRPDAVDPALRRPGRFDREIYFPLPSLEDRAGILSLHTQKWPKPVSGSLLKFIARKTVGFAGADLQALCTQAAIIALKRSFPLQDILSAAGKNCLGGERIPLPSFLVEERDWLEALSRCPPPCSLREAGIAANEIVSSPLPTYLIPCLLEPLSVLLVSLHLNANLCLPPSLSRAASRVKSVIFSAIEKRKLSGDLWLSHLHDIVKEVDIVEEIERELSSSGFLLGQFGSVGSDAPRHDDNGDNSAPFLTFNKGNHSFLAQNISFASIRKSGYRLLISGTSGSGQRHIASCLLHCYVGNMEVQKIDLATFSQEGHGDAVQGMTRILMKCTNAGSSVVFMPRVDLWAVETHHEVASNDESKSTPLQHLASEKATVETDHQVLHTENKSPIRQDGDSERMVELQASGRSASPAWISFIEQVESICVNTSLVILATSEIPYAELPNRVRQFFDNDILKGGSSTHVDYALPRFWMHVGGNINFELAINQSAAKMTRNIVQQLVQLIHQSIHISINCNYSSSDFIGQCTETTEQIAEDGSAWKKNDNEAQCCDDSSLKTPQPSVKRNVKGKSNLMSAISTFGYQLLQYPHFAELCWVTSKLKEGPLADVNGPWKGWPFNSCIIRPYNAEDKTAAACGPASGKVEEKYGLVRGLVAIGLSAYRGIYVSAREVSFEIRRVLELLVEQINLKIQAGKDQYEYGRILSQVSYLEDLVNSWAYSLQSLELDAQVTSAKATVPSSANDFAPDTMLQRKELEQQISSGSLEEVQEGSIQVVREDIECDDSKQVNGSSVKPDSEVGADGLDKDTSGKLIGDILIECNGTAIPTEPKTAGDSSMAESSNHSGLPSSVTHSKDGPCIPGRLDVPLTSGSCEIEDQVLDSSPREERAVPVDGNPGSNKDSMIKAASNSGNVCFYRCCSKCSKSLHNFMLKLLIEEWGLNKNNWTVEDIHDAVASLSVDFFSALRRVFADKRRNLFGEGEEDTEYPVLNRCHCNCAVSHLTVPVDCESTESSTSQKCELGFNFEFVVKDGVLEPVDTDSSNAVFHCKFETLCLRPLVELVATTKRLSKDYKL